MAKRRTAIRRYPATYDTTGRLRRQVRVPAAVALLALPATQAAGAQINKRTVHTGRVSNDRSAICWSTGPGAKERDPWARRGARARAGKPTLARGDGSRTVRARTDSCQGCAGAVGPGSPRDRGGAHEPEQALRTRAEAVPRVALPPALNSGAGVAGSAPTSAPTAPPAGAGAAGGNPSGPGGGAKRRRGSSGGGSNASAGARRSGVAAEGTAAGPAGAPNSGAAAAAAAAGPAWAPKNGGAAAGTAIVGAGAPPPVGRRRRG